MHVRRGTDRAVVTLADPARLNTLSSPAVMQAKAALTGLVADPAIHVIVLTGADPGFSAGGDLEPSCFTTAAFAGAVRELRGDRAAGPGVGEGAHAWVNGGRRR